MKAYQLTAWQTPPQLREVVVPEPGPGEVLLKVGGAGACHSDLHLMEYGPWGCGRCRACRRSAESYCEYQAEIGAFGGGLGLDGGLAEYMLVPDARLLLPLGDLDPRDAAPLSDAALTPYHAVKRSLDLLVPGSTAVVIGVVGLGHMAVQILRALSPARAIAGR